MEKLVIQEEIKGSFLDTRKQLKWSFFAGVGIGIVFAAVFWFDDDDGTAAKVLDSLLLMLGMGVLFSAIIVPAFFILNNFKKNRLRTFTFQLDGRELRVLQEKSGLKTQLLHCQRADIVGWKFGHEISSGYDLGMQVKIKFRNPHQREEEFALLLSYVPEVEIARLQAFLEELPALPGQAQEGNP